jgi:hypothetical protein
MRLVLRDCKICVLKLVFLFDVENWIRSYDPPMSTSPRKPRNRDFSLTPSSTFTALSNTTSPVFRLDLASLVSTATPLHFSSQISRTVLLIHPLRELLFSFLFIFSIFNFSCFCWDLTVVNDFDVECDFELQKLWIICVKLLSVMKCEIFFSWVVWMLRAWRQSGKNVVWRDYDKILNLMVRFYFPMVGKSFPSPP